MSRRFAKVVMLGMTLLLVSGCVKKSAPGALKVQSNPVTTVTVDGQEVGNTPYSGTNMDAGQVTLKLSSADSSVVSWEGVVDITSGVYTVVNYDLGPTMENTGGEVLTLEPTNQSIASMTVLSDPDGSMVKVDGSSRGPTPLEISQIDAGEHQVQISSPGYGERIIPVSIETGYKLVVDAKLAKLATPEISLNEEEASPSGELNEEATTTPGASKTSPTPTKTASGKTPVAPYIKILSTPTGWLRVRKEASAASDELGKVNPDETYHIEDESNGWYKIEFEKDSMGWVSGQYAKKYSE